MGMRTSVCLLLGLATAMAAAKADPIETSGGLVSGVAVSDGAVRTYKGIPFAKPPVGELRWRPPQPADRWTGVRLQMFLDNVGGVGTEALARLGLEFKRLSSDVAIVAV